MILQLAKGTNINLDIEPLNKRYNVVLTPTRYNKKPSNYKKLHDELNSAKTINLTLYELLEEVMQGRTWRNGIYDYPELKDNEKALIEKWKQENNATDKEVSERINQYRTAKGHKRNALIKTNLAVLDIDDVLGQSDPIEVMEEMGAIALYYTFSHDRMSKINTQENRYRLLFDLSEAVTGKEQLKYIQEDIRKKLLQKHPYLNDQKIGNKAHGVENITTQFHGTNKGYEVNTAFRTYEVANLIEQHEREQEFNQSLMQLERMTRSNETVEADEIINIANYLGDLNDILSFDEWRTLAIGLWNTAQLQGIDDSIIIEALEILNGHEKDKDEQYYLGFKLPLIESTNRATIRTLYRVAIDKGYKLQIKQPQEENKDLKSNEVQPIIIDRFIGAENYLKLLKNNDRRILLVSETGTGKTRSAIEASEELNKQNKKSFVYIALPAIALAEQTEKKYGTNTAIIGTNKVNTKLEVQKATSNGTRLLIGTYNKADEVCSYLTDYDVTVIADEAHKEISDYYKDRTIVINELFDITDRENVVKFIAMTGTPSEIDYSTYDSVVPFKLKEPKVLADKLQFIEYYTTSLYENVTSRIIEQEVQQGKKVLSFVDNKTLISKIARALRKKGLKVSTIQANEKNRRKSKTYRHILDNEKFDDETDVILSTRLLADGINIQNTKEYVLVIAPNHSKGANFYNLDLIRQASNRFRNQYEKIVIPLYVNQEIYKDDEHPRASERLYNLEYQYQSLMRTASIIKAQSESIFKDNIQYFTPSIAENLAGLFRPREAERFNFKRAYENKALAEQGLNHDKILLQELEELEQDIFTIDKRHIRSQASEDKETYYKLYPYAFRKALTESLEVLEVESIQAHEYFLNKKSDLASILDEIHALDTKNNKEKRKDLNIVLHELIYTKLKKDFYMKNRVDESIDEWQLLKEKMNSFQYTALKNVIGFLEYDEALRELEYVEKQAQTNELVKGFNAMTEYANFILQDAGKEQETERIFNILHDNVIGKEFYSVAEKDDLIDELAREYRIKRYNIAKKKELFKGVFNKFFVEAQSKTQRVDGKVKRVRSYQLINFKYLADQRGITTDEVIALYKRYMYK